MIVGKVGESRGLPVPPMIEQLAGLWGRFSPAMTA